MSDEREKLLARAREFFFLRNNHEATRFIKEMLADFAEKELSWEWVAIKAVDDLPEDETRVWWTNKLGEVDKGLYVPGNSAHYVRNYKAWMPYHEPEPYKPEEAT